MARKGKQKMIEEITTHLAYISARSAATDGSCSSHAGLRREGHS